MGKTNYCGVGFCPSATVVDDKMVVVGKKTSPPKKTKVADDEAVVEISLEIVKKALNWLA